MVLSAPTILRSRFKSQAYHLCFFNLDYWNCNEKRPKINEKRLGSVHLKSIWRTLTDGWGITLRQIYDFRRIWTWIFRLKVNSTVTTRPQASAENSHHWEKYNCRHGWYPITSLKLNCFNYIPITTYRRVWSNLILPYIDSSYNIKCSLLRLFLWFSGHRDVCPELWRSELKSHKSLHFIDKDFKWWRRCRHSSVDSSTPTNPMPWVQVPSAFSIYSQVCDLFALLKDKK